MNFKIPERWKRPFRLALVIVMLAIFLILNNWGFDFQINFHLKSLPIGKDTPADTALRTQVTIEDPVIRYRDRPS